MRWASAALVVTAAALGRALWQRREGPADAEHVITHVPFPQGGAGGVSPLALLEAAKASPLVVHDEAAWTGLFAPDAVIEDPVGGPRHVDLSRFYRIFIQGKDIDFESEGDFVDVAGLRVVRCVTLHIKPHNGGWLRMPVHIFYQFVSDGSGALKVAHLKAHWGIARPRFPSVAAVGQWLVGALWGFHQFLQVESPAWVASLVLDFAKAPLSRGHEAVVEFLEAWKRARGSERELAALAERSFVDPGAACVQLGVEGRVATPAAALVGLPFEELVFGGDMQTAGFFASVRFSLDGVPSYALFAVSSRRRVDDGLPLFVEAYFVVSKGAMMAE